MPAVAALERSTRVPDATRSRRCDYAALGSTRIAMHILRRPKALNGQWLGTLATGDGARFAELAGPRYA